MAKGEIWGLASHEIIIPIISWTLIALQYLYLVQRGAFANAFDKLLSQQPKPVHYPFVFFSKARQGWVVQNFLTGQASANSTRSLVLFNFLMNALEIIFVWSYSLQEMLQVYSPCSPFLTCPHIPRDFCLFPIYEVLGILVVGYTVASFKSSDGPREHLRSFQLAFLSFLLFVIFFVFLYSTRFALHHQWVFIFLHWQFNIG